MKLNQKHYKIFKDECKKWIDVFGLKEYSVAFEFTKLKGAYATSNPSYDSKIVTIKLGTNIDDLLDHGKDLDGMVKEWALHEVLHVVLNPIYCLSIARHATRAEIDQAEEGIVVRLTNVLAKNK